MDFISINDVSQLPKQLAIKSLMRKGDLCKQFLHQVSPNNKANFEKIICYGCPHHRLFNHYRTLRATNARCYWRTSNLKMSWKRKKTAIFTWLNTYERANQKLE